MRKRRKLRRKVVEDVEDELCFAEELESDHGEKDQNKLRRFEIEENIKKAEEENPFGVKVKKFFYEIYEKALLTENLTFGYASYGEDGELEKEMMWRPFLTTESLRRILKEQKTGKIEEFCRNNFSFSESLRRSREILVQLILDAHRGKETDLEKRDMEGENIDEDYILSSTSHYYLCEVCIPKDVMLLILSYLTFDFKLLTSLGCANSSFYLLILSNWKSSVLVKQSTLYKISALVLKSMNVLVLDNDFTEVEMKYIIEKVSHPNVRELHFGKSCSFEFISKFIEYLTNNNVVFNNCRLLLLPKIFKLVPRFGRKRKGNKQDRLVIRSKPFPTLRTIDNLDLNFVDATEILTLRNIVLGSRFEHQHAVSVFGKSHVPISHRNKSNSTGGGKSFFYMQPQNEINIFSTAFSELTITSLSSRIKDSEGYINYQKVIENLNIVGRLKNITRLELLIANFAFDSRKYKYGILDDEDTVFSELKNLEELKVINLFQHKNFSYTNFIRDCVNPNCPNIHTLKLRNVSPSIVVHSLQNLKKLARVEIVFSTFESFSLGDPLYSFLGTMFSTKKNIKFLELVIEREGVVLSSIPIYHEVEDRKVKFVVNGLQTDHLSSSLEDISGFVKKELVGDSAICLETVLWEEFDVLFNFCEHVKKNMKLVHKGSSRVDGTERKLYETFFWTR